MQTKSLMKRVFSWLAGVAVAAALVMVSVALLADRQTSTNVEKLAADIGKTLGDDRALQDVDSAFAETDRLIAKLGRQTEEAQAHLDVATGEIATVGDWRAASSIAQVVRAEYWLRAALGDQAQGLTDETFRSTASWIADCVNSSIRNLSSIDDDPAVVYGVKCIARLGG